jgi:hypothetical protein
MGSDRLPAAKEKQTISPVAGSKQGWAENGETGDR